uniref:DNA from chromosome XV (contains gpd3, arg1, gpm3, sp2, gal11 genes) n=1 Tax=Saccharomyces cerevisiae TaxID=4932 RepID=E9PA97_YEASX|nr:unnamed protein product [Saccharomyces cerevisiae]
MVNIGIPVWLNFRVIDQVFIEITAWDFVSSTFERLFRYNIRCSKTFITEHFLQWNFHGVNMINWSIILDSFFCDITTNCHGILDVFNTTINRLRKRITTSQV